MSKLELKKLGREIAKFPNEMFRSNAINAKQMRLSAYLKSRQSDVSENDILDAKKTLEDLKANKKIVWAIFV